MHGVAHAGAQLALTRCQARQSPQHLVLRPPPSPFLQSFCGYAAAQPDAGPAATAESTAESKQGALLAALLLLALAAASRSCARSVLRAGATDSVGSSQSSQPNFAGRRWEDSLSACRSRRHCMPPCMHAIACVRSTPASRHNTSTAVAAASGCPSARSARLTPPPLCAPAWRPLAWSPCRLQRPCQRLP